jgi:hypothetical protein
MNPIREDLSSKGYEVVLKRDKTTGEEIGELDFITFKSTSLSTVCGDMMDTLLGKNKDHPVDKLLGDVKVKEFKNKAFALAIGIALDASIYILLFLSVISLAMLHASPAVIVLLGVYALVHVLLMAIYLNINAWTNHVIAEKVSLLEEAINEKLKSELNSVPA